MSSRINLQDLEDIANCLEEVKNIMLARLVPEEARTHFRQAEKEALLGVRSLLDAAIDRLGEKHVGGKGENRNRPRHIPVED